MYTSFSIENFRLFDDITIKPLARVNLIGGKNNVGKTALLEALWIHAHGMHPQRAAAISNQRGVSFNHHPELLADWFPQGQTDLVASFKAQGNWGAACRSLKVYCRERECQEQIYDAEQVEPDFGVTATNPWDLNHEIVFVSENENDGKSISSLWRNESRPPNQRPYTISVKREQKSAPLNPVPCEFVGLRHRPHHQKFSEIERKGYLPDVEEIIRQLEPGLQHLTLIADNRGQPAIYGKFAAGEHLPIALLGTGANCLLDMALALLSARNGILLVDEIENGIHHRQLVPVWKNIEQLTRKFNVQMFATTHRFECIKAAHNAFTLNEVADELSYVRLQRNLKTQRLECIAYDDLEGFAYAMKYGREVH